MFGLDTFLLVQFINKGFEIMDMKKCVAIALNITRLRLM